MLEKPSINAACSHVILQAAVDRNDLSSNLDIAVCRTSSTPAITAQLRSMLGAGSRVLSTYYSNYGGGREPHAQRVH